VNVLYCILEKVEFESNFLLRMICSKKLLSNSTFSRAADHFIDKLFLLL